MRTIWHINERQEYKRVHGPRKKATITSINEEETCMNKTSAIYYQRFLFFLFYFTLFLSLLDSLSSGTPKVYVKNKYYVHGINCIRLVFRPLNSGIIIRLLRQSSTRLSIGLFASTPRPPWGWWTRTSGKTHRCGKWVVLSYSTCVKEYSRARGGDYESMDASIKEPWRQRRSQCRWRRQDWVWGARARSLTSWNDKIPDSRLSYPLTQKYRKWSQLKCKSRHLTAILQCWEDW